MCIHNTTQLMSYVYGPPIIDSRIKALDVGIPLLQTEFEVRGLNTIHQLSNVMYDLEGLGNLSWTWTLGSNMRIISKENKIDLNFICIIIDIVCFILLKFKP